MADDLNYHYLVIHRVIADDAAHMTLSHISEERRSLLLKTYPSNLCRICPSL